MMPELKSRLLRGVGADGISQGVLAFIRLAEVPLLLYFWGVNLYGEWLIVTALPTYLAISDFGFTHVTSRQIVMQVAKGDKEEALATFQSSSVLVALTSCLIALMFFLLIWLIPVAEAFNVSRIAGEELLAIAALLGVKIIVSMQSGMLGGALQATGHYPLFILWSTAVFLVEFLLLAVVVALGGGPVMVAIAMLVGIVVGLVVLRVMVAHFAPWFHYGLGAFRLEIVRKLAKPAFAALSFPASNALNIQGTRLIIGSVLGPAAVALFATHRQLAGFVSKTNIIGKSFCVEMGLAYGANDMVLFRKLSLRGIQILLWGAMVSAIFISIAAHFAFPLWTNGRLALDPLLFTMLVTATLGDVVWRAAFFPASATNRHIHLARVVLVVNMFTLLFMYVLCFYYGTTGASFVLMISAFIMVFYSIRNAMNITNMAAKKFLISVMHPPLFVLSRKKA